MEMKHVGILVDAAIYNGLPRGKTKHEAISFYENAALSFNLMPCYFKLQSIKMGSTHVQAYIKKGTTYIKKTIPIPKVIHNRSLFNRRLYLNRIKYLEAQGIIVFNYWNRYSKLHIYNLLMQEESLRSHLPYTVSASISNARKLMSMYDSLIIKPNIGSIGRGIVKIARNQSKWVLTYPKDKKGTALGTTTFSQVLPERLKKKLRSKNYVLQQRLPLALYKGCPFDLRVSVQRDHTGSWQVTGIAGKVAAKNKYVTNVAQGGTVYTLDVLLQQFPYLKYEQVKNDVEQFSLRVAAQLSHFIPRLADIGLDVGITEFGYPVFIECNNRDLRYSFAKANMIAEWKSSYRNPIGYARFLLDAK